MVGDGVRAVIVGEFRVGDRLGPGCGVIAAEDAEIGLYLLIDSFRFTVRLWVVGGREREVVM